MAGKKQKKRGPRSKVAAAGCDGIPINVRCAPALVRQIDAYADKFQAEHPGMPISRASVVRMFTLKGLAAEGMAPEAD